MANPFYVQPVNAFETFQIGQKAYGDASKKAGYAALAQNGTPSLADLAKFALTNGDPETFKSLAQLAQTQAYQNATLEIARGNQDISRGSLDVSRYNAMKPPDRVEMLRDAGIKPGTPEARKALFPTVDAEKALPAELASRTAMAGNFLDQVPFIQQKVGAGDVTGPWDAAMGQLGFGQQGEIVRKVQSGAEALLRSLTGAGMGLEEAKKYVKRYEPGVTDTAATLTSKLTQLKDELTRAEEETYRGRGGIPKAVSERRADFLQAAEVLKLDPSPARRKAVGEMLRKKYGTTIEGDF